ncbi:PREDICTED: LOC18787508 [Prunus dulcis]|uniref:PREDICTED: LOC18787508 n=1 Tax=Prunus dulcis TaxID=3755 RepID=A0A5E4FNN1_PRUDU|nr:PREDICTED: LOC18787508 [Prunus dulcis]
MPENPTPHNHPKKQFCNLPSIAPPFGSFYDLLEILYRLIEQGQDAAERLHCDPDYKLLHDRVMDVFMEQLKSDIDKFKQHKLDLKPSDYITDGDEDNDDDEEEDDKDGTLDAET